MNSNIFSRITLLTLVQKNLFFPNKFKPAICTNFVISKQIIPHNATIFCYTLRSLKRNF